MNLSPAALPKRGILYATVFAITVLIISSRLDFIAGTVPQYRMLTPVVRAFNFLGDGVVVFSACLILCLAGITVKKASLKETGLRGLLAAGASGVVVQILKAVFERPRPMHSGAILKLGQSPMLFDLSGRFNSFPSGHTFISFAAAYAVGRHYPRLRPFLFGGAALVGIARVYLGAHYPSDVAAAALLGICVGYLSVNKFNVKLRWLIFGLLLLATSVAFFKSGSFFLFDVDEAVFSEATREMVETGDYITPTYNYEPRYDKPILFYWAMAGAFKIFGINEFGARFASGAFGVLLVMMTFFFVRRVKDERAALLASLALLVNVEYFVYTHSAVTDMTLAFFITASLYSFYMGLIEEDRKWPLLFWAASALAVLTKGAIGLLFPVAIGGAYLFLGQRPSSWKRFITPSGMGLFLAVSLPWFIAELSVNGWAFINAFVIKHHFKRYTEVISSHGGPPYYYIGVLIIGFFPWAAFLPQALYKGFKEHRGKTGGLYLFAAVWFVFVLVFFSISFTKLPNYIFPLMPAASMLAGLFASEIIDGAPGSRIRGLYVLIILSAIFAATMFMFPKIGINADIALPPALFYGLGVIFISFLVLAFTAAQRPVEAFAGITATMIMLLVFLRVFGVPIANRYLQRDLYLLATEARNAVSNDKDAVIASYETNKPSLVFYAQKKIFKIERSNARDIEGFARNGRLLIITSKAKADELKPYDYMKPIDEKGKYVLLGNTEPRGHIQ